MAVTSKVSGNEVVLNIEGNFDIGCYEEFNQIVSQHLNDKNVFVLDLSNTHYIDSSALGMLLLLREKTGGDAKRVKFINVKNDVLKVLKMAKFDLLFTIG